MQTGPDPGDIRRTLVELCNHGQFIAAHMHLLDSDLAVQHHPNLWELIERRAAEAGETALADTVRRALLEADVASIDTILAQARHDIQQDQPDRAQALLVGHFGTNPADVEVRVLLGIALASDNKDAALPLLQDAGQASETEMLWAVDALRTIGAQKRAFALCQTAIKRFPRNVLFNNRLGWIAEAIGDFETAILAANRLLDGDTDAQARALNRLVRLYRRLGDREKTIDHAAHLLRLETSPLHKLRLARNLGQLDLMHRLVGTLPSERARGQLPDNEAKQVLRFLLEDGHIGWVAYLAHTGFPIDTGVRRTLELAGLSGDTVHPPKTAELGAKIRSPDILFPLYPERRDLWSGTTAFGPAGTGGTILLANSVLAAGGAERQFLMLVRALIAASIPPDSIHAALFSLEEDRGHNHFEAALRATGIHVHDLSRESLAKMVLPDREKDMLGVMPMRLSGDVAALYGLAQRVRPAVIHGWQDRSAVACGIVGQMLQINRIVLSVRNMRPKKRGDDADWIARAVYADLVQQRTVALTANAGEGARDYENWLDLDAGAVSILPNAVDETVFWPRTRQKPKDRPIEIVGVFRLAENKRPLLWLETLAALRCEHGLKIAPRIVGAGPMAEDVRRHAANIGLGDLRLDPPVEDPSGIYRESDVLLLMSQVEGTPNVVLEAQASGLPVAACDVGGVAEALYQGDAGGGLLLAAQISPKEAAARIAQWLPGARAADEQPRVEFVMKRYSLTALADRLFGLYGMAP